MRSSVVPIEVGWRARAALAHAQGRARRLAALSASVYLEAAGEVIWLGPAGAALHGRAALLPSPPPGAAELMIDVGHARCWRPAPPGAPALAGVVAGCRGLRATITALGHPLGLGTLLAGAPPPFLLAPAADPAGALARACPGRTAGT